MSVASLMLQALWLALPVTVAGVLHMVVVKRDWLPAWRRPLDGGRTLRGVRLFGDHKTWRGVAVMIVLTALLGAVQGALTGRWAMEVGLAAGDLSRWGLADGWLAQATGHAVVNALLGLGYVVGELPNSFLKRRLQVRPGQTERGVRGVLLSLLDQADSVLAGLALGCLALGWRWSFFLVGVATLTALHLLFNVTLLAVRLRRQL